MCQSTGRGGRGQEEAVSLIAATSFVGDPCSMPGSRAAGPAPLRDAPQLLVERIVSLDEAAHLLPTFDSSTAAGVTIIEPARRS